MQVNSIAEKLFFNTVKIATRNLDGREGSGTGFFFEITHDGVKIPLIVTNKHVVEGSHTGSMKFHRNNEGQPMLGESLDINVGHQDWAGMWVGHPDPKIDITVCGFGPIANAFIDQHQAVPFYSSVTPNEIPTLAQIEELDALEEIAFVGYPNGIWDSVNLLPVIRKGTTATPLQVDFEGTPKFLIDASVFGGSSGSPVYIANTGSFADKRGNFTIANRFFFVGVIAAVFHRTNLNEIVSMPIPTAVKTMAVQQEMIDLGIVYKSTTVLQAAENFIAKKIKE